MSVFTYQINLNLSSYLGVYVEPPSIYHSKRRSMFFLITFPIVHPHFTAFEAQEIYH